MSNCNICPRKCIDNSVGFCNKNGLRIAKIMRHRWEEPPISFKNGSGCIFFSGCPLKCVFCQNHEISHNNNGKIISVKELADIFKFLEENGLENINLVSPTHYTEKIIQALSIYKPRIPIVWNTSGYENLETIKRLNGLVDIYLTDLKYCDSKLSRDISKASDYFDCASLAIKEMKNQQPIDEFSDDGKMKKGLIIRHLILPNHTNDSVKILDWINTELGNQTLISIMSQFTPCVDGLEKFNLNRPITQLEYKRVLSYAQKCGFNGFSQEFDSSSKQYIPDFSLNKFIEI